MKKCKKEKLELLAYAQDVNMYAESFSALYKEVEKDTSTDLEVQDKNRARANAYLDYCMYPDDPLTRLRGLCKFFEAGPHLMGRINEIKQAQDFDIFVNETESSVFQREILATLKAIRNYV